MTEKRPASHQPKCLHDSANERTKQSRQADSLRVILPIEYDVYQETASDPKRFRHWLDEMIARYPELFPRQIEEGYTLHDALPESVKLPGVCYRRIQLKAVNEVGDGQYAGPYASSDVMPYMTGFTDDVEKALFLRRFGVPFWGLTYVFGHNDDYWYHLTSRFGRYAIVETVVKDPDRLPTDLLADEKHVHFNGEKGYIATTVGADCVLGASLALTADETALSYTYMATSGTKPTPSTRTTRPKPSIQMGGRPPRRLGRLSSPPSP